MMYELIDKISKINTFQVKHQNVLLTDLNRNLIYENKIIAEDVRSFYLCGNSILYYHNNKTYIYSEGTVIDEIEESIYNSTFSNGTILTNKKIVGGRNISLYYFNCKKFELIKTFEGIYTIGNHIRVNDIFFHQQGHTTLKSLSLLSGEYEWELEFGERITQLGSQKIEKIIGVHNDILWVSCDKALFGIAISSGEVKHQITEPTRIAYQSGELKYFRGHNGQIDFESNKIVGFEFETYYELDLKDLSLTYWIFTNECDSLAIEARYSKQNIHLGEDIFFVDKLHFKIGIFDRKQMSIDTAFAFPENSCTGLLNDLQISDNKIYVLDTGGTLHILQREDTAL